MPGTDGYSLIRQVRRLANEANRVIPAAALTAYARSEDRTAALRAGFDVHVTKPVDPSELLVVIATLVASVRRHRRQSKSWAISPPGRSQCIKGRTSQGRTFSSA